MPTPLRPTGRAIRAVRAVFRATWRGALAISAVAFVLVAVGVASIAYAVRTGMLTLAVVGPAAAPAPSPKGMLVPSRLARVADACAAPARDGDEVRDLVRTFVDEGVPYVSPDAERTVVLMVSGPLSERLGAAGGMSVILDRGFMVLDADSPLQGDAVYHELVHEWQFRLPWPQQMRLVNALAREDSLPGGLTANDAVNAWMSVAHIVTAGFADSTAASLRDTVLERWRTDSTRRQRRPVARLLAVAERTMEQPAYAAARSRSRLLGWSHRGLPPSRPPKNWQWQDEVRRLMYMEAMANHVESRCSPFAWRRLEAERLGNG